MKSRCLKTATLALLLSASLASTSVNVSAQTTASTDAAAPVFTQQATNVFRRFAVDLAKMKKFYGDVLGLKPLPTLNMPGGGQMTRFHAGASEIKLQSSAAESQAPRGGVRDVTGLRVLTFFFPDGAALTARFSEHGYPVPEFHKTSGGVTGMAVAMVRDPSDQWVELVVVPGAPAETYDRLEIGLTVADVETSRTFYRGFVGLEELKPVEDAVLGTTKYPFRLGTTTINVWSFGTGRPANKSSAGIQYVVGNVDAIDARGKAKGIKIDRPLSDFTAALRTVWMSDPDGITNYFAQVARRTPAPDSQTR